MKKLIVAEKNSVASEIAKVVGSTERHHGYFDGENYVVTWCNGHLIEYEDPDAYGYKDWNIQSLPIIPTVWKYRKVEYKKEEDLKKKNPSFKGSGTKQIDVLEKLFFRDDIASFVEATDAGREGENIFRLIYYYFAKQNPALLKKPFERLWISSLEKESIRKGMENLRPSKEFDNLYCAASSRARADWIFGFNGTRLYTVTKPVNNGTTSVGRVQTPTLNMIVQRELERESFVAEKYFVIVKKFGDKWALETDKISKESDAKECFSDCKDKAVVVKDMKVERKVVNPYRLYSLSSLQQSANKTYGYTAKQTLEAAQSLYENKILTYPRTDSEYLTEDEENTFGYRVSRLARKYKLDNFKIHNIKRVIDNTKVTDHSAIIVTNEYANYGIKEGFKITKSEEDILHLVEARMILSVCDKYIYEETKVVADSAGYIFKGSGKKIVNFGYKDFEKILLPSSIKKEKDTNSFPENMDIGLSYKSSLTQISPRSTEPPPRYTEAELLKAMERAGSKEMDSAVERKGLGTSATRADMIETLVERHYIQKIDSKGGRAKTLVPTSAGRQLINNVSPSFKDVGTTVLWENELLKVERGEKSFKEFDNSISALVRQIVCDIENDFKNHTLIGKCPYCSGEIHNTGESASFVKCTSCNAHLYRKQNILAAGHKISDDEFRALLGGKSIRVDISYVDKKSHKNVTKNVGASIDFVKSKTEKKFCFKFKF